MLHIDRQNNRRSDLVRVALRFGQVLAERLSIGVRVDFSNPACRFLAIGGMRLLPGYTHKPLQGFDSIVGEISKKGGLQIRYEIGAIPKPGGIRMGGMFSDRPKSTPKAQLRWYREQVVNNQPVHLAYSKGQILMVSYPLKGINLHVTVRTADEMAEALLMILTYPGPPAPAAGGGR